MIRAFDTRHGNNSRGYLVYVRHAWVILC